MELRQFISLCQVWNCEHFWHVYVNTKNPELQHKSTILKLMTDISKCNADCYIRFTFPTGEIIWMYNGISISPFESSFVVANSSGIVTRNNGLDQSKALKTSQINNNTGFYRVELSSEYLNQDMPTLISSSSSRIVLWENTAELAPTDNRAGWDSLSRSIPLESPVRFFHHKKVLWCDGENFRRISKEKHTEELDEFLYEYGTISSLGQLTLTRIVAFKTFLWADKMRLNQPSLHRTDGPAKVVLYNVKELYQGKFYNRTVMGTYFHEWYLNGKHISHTDINRVCKQNHITLYQGPCHDRSAFLNEQDHMLWLSSFSR